MLSYGCYFESEKKVSCVQIKNFVTFLIAPIFFINAIKKLHIIKSDNGKFLVYICIICTILGKKIGFRRCKQALQTVCLISKLKCNKR